MSEWIGTDRSVLEKHYRPIVHLRRQFEAGRLTLVFGTGLSRKVGIPGWSTLNDMIASDPAVQGTGLLGRPPEESISAFIDAQSRDTLVKLILSAGPEETITTQKLFEHYKQRRYKESDPEDYHTPKLDAEIYRDWKDIIRRNLYEVHKAKLVPKEILAKHPYLGAFLPIIKSTPLTITYNFDDTIEMALYHDPHKQEGRGYETVTDIRVLPRRDSAVIYHPNGYIPRNPMEEKTQEIVLSESEFANRMIEVTSGQYNSLLHVLSRNTCLFIGLSLRDSILKNLLKQSALISPGNYHYFVHYYAGDHPSDDERSAIEETNCETYNLITLCLNDDKLASLGRMIYVGYKPETKQLEDDRIVHLAEEVGISEQKLCFYVVGAIGAGKSTCVSHLRSLTTHDEWLDDRLPQLAENWKALEKKKDERGEVDDWIASQFQQKNYKLSDAKIGISVCDRCPLDPVSFTPPAEWPQKADKLLATICPGQTQKPIKSGHVIVLLHDPEHLEVRVRRTKKKYDRDSLKELQDSLRQIYRMEGVTFIDCRFLSFYEIMKRVCRIIHMDNYQPASIHKRLEDIKKGLVIRDDPPQA